MVLIMWPSNILIYKMFGTTKVDTYAIEAYFWKVFLNKVCDKFVRHPFSKVPIHYHCEMEFMAKVSGIKRVNRSRDSNLFSSFHLIFSQNWSFYAFCKIFEKKKFFSLNPFLPRYRSICSVNIVLSSNTWLL